MRTHGHRSESPPISAALTTTELPAVAVKVQESSCPALARTPTWFAPLVSAPWAEARVAERTTARDMTLTRTRRRRSGMIRLRWGGAMARRQARRTTGFLLRNAQ